MYACMYLLLSYYVCSYYACTYYLYFHLDAHRCSNCHGSLNLTTRPLSEPQFTDLSKQRVEYVNRITDIRQTDLNHRDLLLSAV